MRITNLIELQDEIAARYGEMIENDEVDPVWGLLQQGLEMDEESTMSEVT